MAFRIGDIVRLRYGNTTPMRVEKVEISGANEWVTCVWGVNNECRNYFAAELLQPTKARSETASAGTTHSLWDRLMSWLRG